MSVKQVRHQALARMDTIKAATEACKPNPRLMAWADEVYDALSVVEEHGDFPPTSVRVSPAFAERLSELANQGAPATVWGYPIQVDEAQADWAVWAGVGA